MKVSSQLHNLCVESLVQSMDIRTMTHMVRRLIPDYDLNRRTGFPESIPIPRQNAASQIIKDIKDGDLFTYFVEILIDMQLNGYMGKKYPIAHLKKIIAGVHEQGFIYDRENSIFVEDPAVRRTRNWGSLRNGVEYMFSFLRLDIAGNTNLVKKYPAEVIQETYGDLRSIVSDIIDKRNGRIWSWEGDGGLVAFFFGNRNRSSMISAMSIVNEIYFYNRFRCRLDGPLEVRVAVHTGSCEFTGNEEEIKKSDPVKRVIEIEEKYTRPNTATVSNVTHLHLPPTIAEQLVPLKIDEQTTYYSYELRWEE
jgi:hypothetical protein